MKFYGALAAGLVVGQMCFAQGFEEDFAELDHSKWSVADYVFKHPSFDTDWRADLAQIDKGLVLGLVPQKGMENRFAGASVRRHEATGFGRYEVVMQPARGAGIVTGFFTYTGPYYGTRHDEIDIEFLGKDTTKIHLAYFVDGVLWNKFIDLGFDAADTPQDYAFEWGPDYLRWYVGDRMILERTLADGMLPQVPGMLFANIWAADDRLKVWSGMAKPGIFGEARVERIRFVPMVAAGAV